MVLEGVMIMWNPDLYLKFKRERTQAVKDLIFRIKKEKPERILDLGCGPGNSTGELRKRWPEAEIIGLDSSEEMLEKARSSYPDIEWVQADGGEDLSFLEKFDIVFSNATIQWIPGHKRLLNNLVELINEDGILAVQVPNTKYMPIRIAINETAEDDKWQKKFHNMKQYIHYEELSFYYDVLYKDVKEIELWETTYNHVMLDHESIIEWYNSTGMRPYLEKLEQWEKDEFAESVLKKIRKSYKLQSDGKVLFPFRRLFFIAYK